MNITVKNSAIGVASAVIDMGDGHSLVIRVNRESDRYRDVSVVWQLPAQRSGTIEQIRDRSQVNLARTALDLRQRETVEPAVARDFLRRNAR